jgi:hypothetical protein
MYACQSRPSGVAVTISDNSRLYRRGRANRLILAIGAIRLEASAARRCRGPFVLAKTRSDRNAWLGGSISEVVRLCSLSFVIGCASRNELHRRFAKAPTFPDVGATSYSPETVDFCRLRRGKTRLLAAAAVNMRSSLTSWLAKNGRTRSLMSSDAMIGVLRT